MKEPLKGNGLPIGDSFEHGRFPMGPSYAPLFDSGGMCSMGLCYMMGTERLQIKGPYSGPMVELLFLKEPKKNPDRP